MFVQTVALGILVGVEDDGRTLLDLIRGGGRVAGGFANGLPDGEVEGEMRRLQFVGHGGDAGEDKVRGAWEEEVERGWFGLKYLFPGECSHWDKQWECGRNTRQFGM